MSPEELQQYLAVIKEFADPAVTLVFGATVKAVFYRNLMWLISILLMQLGGAAFAIRLLVSYRARKARGEYFDGDPYYFGIVLGVAVAVLFLLAWPRIICCLLVPEARAIEILLLGAL